MQAQEALERDEPGVFWAAHQADLPYSQIERLVNLDQLLPMGFVAQASSRGSWAAAPRRRASWRSSTTCWRRRRPAARGRSTRSRPARARAPAPASRFTQAVRSPSLPCRPDVVLEPRTRRAGPGRADVDLAQRVLERHLRRLVGPAVLRDRHSSNSTSRWCSECSMIAWSVLEMIHSFRPASRRPAAPARCPGTAASIPSSAPAPRRRARCSGSRARRPTRRGCRGSRGRSASPPGCARTGAASQRSRSPRAGGGSCPGRRASSYRNEPTPASQSIRRAVAVERG